MSKHRADHEINRPTLHHDGSVTFWSVYHQTWERTRIIPPDRELAAMGADNRKRVCLHLAASGDQDAQAYLDELREVRDQHIGELQDEAARAGDHEQVRLP